MTARIVSFEDFTRGEFGDLGPRLPQDLRTQDGAGGWFTGKNVMKYRDGSVGPRPGLKRWTRTGGSWPNGDVRTLYASTTAPEDTFAVIGTKARQMTRSYAPLELTVNHTFSDQSIPVSTSSPTNGQHRTDGNWVVVPGSGIYKAQMGTNTVIFVEALTGRAFRFNKDRQLATHTFNLWYSEPGISGWDTFNDFFAPTSYNGITAIVPLRNGVALPQYATGIDLVTGTIGTASSVLRRVTSRTQPDHPYAVASIAWEFLVMMGYKLPYPTLYNGSTWEELPHLTYCGGYSGSPEADRPHHTVVDLEWNNSWMILSGITAAAGLNRMLLCWDDCRSYHTWGTNVDPYARRFEGGVVMLCVNGTGSTPPEFYAFFPQLDRPGFTSDLYSRPGDHSDTPFDAYLHMPSWSAENGQEVEVVGLDIAFTRWNTGSSSTNHFDVTVEARRRYGTFNPVTSQTQTFDEAGSAASTGGDDVAIHLGFGDQGYGNEFQIKVGNLRGCAIRSIVAVLEQRAERL